MEKVKYCILGAGPAGLTFANRLKQLGTDSYIVLEKEDTAGGLCRSVNVDGAPLDIGGGHFLDVRRPKVCEFLFSFMPQCEWILYDRDSRIKLGDVLVNHPLEANIWQLPLEQQVRYLKSIAVAGCNLGIEKPKKFVDWIYWKLGSCIADDYMLPYNKKMFGKELNALGTYWLEKLPDVSFEETLLSCLEGKPYGNQPGHVRFYYPKEYGYGEVWLRMASALGGNIFFNQAVTDVDIANRLVYTQGGLKIKAEYIVTTIPWDSFLLHNYTDKTGIGEIQQNIESLKKTGVEISYCHEDYASEAQWIYIPDDNISYHRILSRRKFCPNSRGYWTETNIDRMKHGIKEYAFVNEYAYPLNTLDKPLIMSKLLSYMEKRNIIGLGRWGEHEHYNSDVVVERAMTLAEKIANSL